MYEIMRFRNSYPAFDGDITVGEDKKDGRLVITWKKESYSTTLYADFQTKEYTISYIDTESGRECTL